MKTCEGCKFHNICRKLCPEAEEYVNQDFIGYGRSGVFIQQKEWHKESASGNEWLEMMAFWNRHVKYPDAPIDMEDIDSLKLVGLTDKQMNAVVGHLVDGKSLQAVADEEGISRQAIHQRLGWVAHNVDIALQRSEDWVRYKPHIGELKKNRQFIMTMYYEFFDSVTDIADRLGISASGVYSYIKDSIETLENLIDKYNNSD